MKTVVWLLALTFAGGEPQLNSGTGVKFDTLANCQLLADRINEHFAKAKKEPKPVYFCAPGLIVQ